MQILFLELAYMGFYVLGQGRIILSVASPRQVIKSNTKSIAIASIYAQEVPFKRSTLCPVCQQPAAIITAQFSVQHLFFYM